MTLQEYQDFLHSLYIGNGSTPTSGTDEWNHRTNLLSAGINIWNAEKGVYWNELWATLADSAVGLGGDKTVVAATLDYDMPTDFRFLGTFVRTTTAAGQHTYYEIVRPAKAELYKNTTVAACYVTGNKSAGFDLHFLRQPTAGDTINYPYYKEPTVPSATTDVIEMSDPWFCVYYSLSRLHEMDGDGDMANNALIMSQEKLSGMKLQNMLLPELQSNAAQDRDFVRGVEGFGSSGGWGTSRYGSSL